jgi:hypothetical protein
VGQFTQDEASHGAAGMLHQFERRDPEAFRSDPIGRAHLVSGQYLHLFSILEHFCCKEMLKGRGTAGLAGEGELISRCVDGNAPQGLKADDLPGLCKG